MKKIISKHKYLWFHRPFLKGVLMGTLFLLMSLIIVYYANSYTSIHASNYVTDIILDRLPVVNVDLIYSEGAIFFLSILAFLVFIEPRRLPFVLKASAIFIIVRSVFMIMTHIAPPVHQSYLDPTDFIHKISSGDDLFFSAHTGLPFLMVLVFWKEKHSRYFFLFATTVGAGAVLLGHLHYSIDVFSAFFITYGIFHICQWLFEEDFKISDKQTFVD